MSYWIVGEGNITGTNPSFSLLNFHLILVTASPWCVLERSPLMIPVATTFKSTCHAESGHFRCRDNDFDTEDLTEVLGRWLYRFLRAAIAFGILRWDNVSNWSLFYFPGFFWLLTLLCLIFIERALFCLLWHTIHEHTPSISGRLGLNSSIVWYDATTTSQ